MPEIKTYTEPHLETGAQYLEQYVHMYEIPGHKDITPRIVKRYLWSRDRHVDRLKLLAKKDKKKEKKLTALKNFNGYNIDSADIKKCLLSTDFDLQYEAVHTIRSVWPLAERAELIQLVIELNDARLQSVIAEIIPKQPSEIGEYINTVLISHIQNELEKTDGTTRSHNVSLIKFVDTENKVSLLALALKNKNRFTRLMAARMLNDVPLSHQANLKEMIVHQVESGLDSDNPNIQRHAAQMLETLPSNEQAAFKPKISERISEGLGTDDEYRHIQNLRMLETVSLFEAPEYIFIGLESKYVSVRRVAAEMLSRVISSPLLPALVKKALEDADADVRSIAAIQVGNIKPPQRAEMMQHAIQTKDPTVLRLIVAYLKGLNDNDRTQLQEQFITIIKEIFLGTDDHSKKDAVKLIRYIPQPIKQEVFNFAKEEAGNVLVQTSLYEGSDKEFLRRSFSKTGSKTVLFGKTLFNTAIHRQIRSGAFLAWIRAYEKVEIWQDNEFDYVPIEPIISFRANREGTVDVFTGVLDLSLGAWEAMGGDFKRELREDKEKIENVLADLFILHGHTHGNNFCLRFFRDSSGKVDFTRKPRLYVIDFDQAVST